MTDFAKLPDDDRREWRELPETQAFLAWLKKEAESAKTAAIDAISDRTDDRLASMYLGKIRAFDHTFDTATRETFE